jgi:hypothetical protein
MVICNMKPPYTELMYQKFGRLTVKSYAGNYKLACKTGRKYNTNCSCWC